MRRLPLLQRTATTLLAVFGTALLLTTGAAEAQETEVTLVVPPGAGSAELTVPVGSMVTGTYGPFHGDLTPTQDGFLYQPGESFWQTGSDLTFVYTQRPTTLMRVRWVAGATGLDGPVAAMTDPGHGQWQPWQLVSPPENPIVVTGGVVADHAYRMEALDTGPQPQMSVSVQGPAGGEGTYTTSDVVVVIDDIELNRSLLKESDTIVFYRVTEGMDVVLEMEVGWNAQAQTWQVRPTSPLDQSAPFALLDTDYNRLRLVRWSQDGQGGARLTVNDVLTASIGVDPHLPSAASTHEIVAEPLTQPTAGLVLTFEDPVVRTSGVVTELADRDLHDSFTGGPGPGWVALGLISAMDTAPQELPGPGDQLEIDLGLFSPGQSTYTEKTNFIATSEVAPRGHTFRFWVDPSAAVLLADSPLTLLAGCPATGPCNGLRVLLEETGGGLEVAVSAARDDGTIALVNTPVTTAPHLVEVRLRNAVVPGSDTGWVELWVDGTLAGHAERIVNHGRQVETLRFGALGVPAGVGGVLALDDFEAWRFD
jgi:hypothetical protein